MSQVVVLANVYSLYASTHYGPSAASDPFAEYFIFEGGYVNDNHVVSYTASQELNSGSWVSDVMNTVEGTATTFGTISLTNQIATEYGHSESWTNAGASSAYTNGSNYSEGLALTPVEVNDQGAMTAVSPVQSYIQASAGSGPVAIPGVVSVGGMPAGSPGTGEGPYFLATGNASPYYAELYCYNSGALTNVTLKTPNIYMDSAVNVNFGDIIYNWPFSASGSTGPFITGPSLVSGRGISNHLVIPNGNQIWRNGYSRNLADLCSCSTNGWMYPGAYYISPTNDLMVGGATYMGTNSSIAPGVHNVLLLPADFAPDVLRVNSSFNEQKINSTTGNAQPDNYDEDLKIATGHPNAGKITVTNLHQNFFGVKPGTMPNSFFQNATVTITKLNNTDTYDGTGLPEPGTIRLYAIQNLGQSGEQAYPIPISVPGQTLPNSAVPFTTSISTDQPANLVPALYSDSATIPQGSNVTYYMEGVDPGPITLEYRIHFASGSTPDLAMDQHFLVCTQQSKAAWQQDIRQEILLQSGVDMNLYTYSGAPISAPFMTDKTYIQNTYAYYQELFTQKSTLFGWAGLGKLAGADVYGAMDDSEYVRSVIPFWMSPVSNVVANSYADLVQNTLLKGNYEIFDDLAWQYRAYQASGIWALQYASSSGLDVTPTTILPVDLTTWTEMYQGDYSSAPSVVQDATEKILQREQQQIAQRSWNVFHASSIPDFVFSTLTASPLPSGASFETVMGSSADITVYNDRWSWITNPTQGMWQQWNGYSNAVQVGFVGINLRIYSEGYSRFYNWDSSSYPIIW